MISNVHFLSIQCKGNKKRSLVLLGKYAAHPSLSATPIPRKHCVHCFDFLSTVVTKAVKASNRRSNNQKEMKLTDPQRLEVVTFCISYLFEKFPNERGLFRSSVSQTDVRNLQNQLALHSVKAREDLDPHLVAEVLQTTFRDLNSPLMSDIYKDMVAAGNFEFTTFSFPAIERNIQNWLMKIMKLIRNLYKVGC